MSNDPIPFPTSLLKDPTYRQAVQAAANDAGVALDPMKFEQEVLAASQARPLPEIRHQLQMFVKRHAPGTSVVRGEIDGFNWRTGVLMLAKETAKGEGMRSLLTVAHECAHANQKRDWPWLPWWLVKTPGISTWIENNCWHRALQMLT